MRGQTALIFTLLLPVMVGAVDLGADFAVMYYNWLELQKAADSAALAGAGYLPKDTTDANSAANSYAKQNGRTGDTINVTIDSSATPQWVQVQMSRQVPYFFGRVLGLTNATLNVLAKAGIKAISAANGEGGHLLPIGVDCLSGPKSCPGPGTTITLLAGQIGPGDWGTLQLPGMNGVSDGESVTKNGWTSPDPMNPNDVLVPDPNQVSCSGAGPSCLNMQPGNGDVMKVAAGAQDRIMEAQSLGLTDTASNPNPGDPRVVQLPMVDFAGVHGKSTQVPLVGFAEVWIDSVNKDNSITVTFIPAVSPGNTPSPTGASCVGGSGMPCTVVLEQ